MTPRRLSLRICALLIAYALALQGLLAGFGPHASAAAGASAITCLASDGTASPAGQNHDGQHNQDCVLHCLAFNGADAWTPPAAGVVAVFTPRAFDVLAIAPLEISHRPALITPQSPRAPPRA